MEAMAPSRGAPRLLKNHKTLEKRVYSVPAEMDQQIARLKLKAMGVKLDVLTEEQEKYLTSSERGT